MKIYYIVISICFVFLLSSISQAYAIGNIQNTERNYFEQEVEIIQLSSRDNSIITGMNELISGLNQLKIKYVIHTVLSKNDFNICG